MVTIFLLLLFMIMMMLEGSISSDAKIVHRNVAAAGISTGEHFELYELLSRSNRLIC